MLMFNGAASVFMLIKEKKSVTGLGQIVTQAHDPTNKTFL